MPSVSIESAAASPLHDCIVLLLNSGCLACCHLVVPRPLPPCGNSATRACQVPADPRLSPRGAADDGGEQGAWRNSFAGLWLTARWRARWGVAGECQEGGQSTRSEARRPRPRHKPAVCRGKVTSLREVWWRWRLVTRRRQGRTGGHGCNVFVLCNVYPGRECACGGTIRCGNSRSCAASCAVPWAARGVPYHHKGCQRRVSVRSLVFVAVHPAVTFIHSQPYTLPLWFAPSVWSPPRCRGLLPPPWCQRAAPQAHA